MNAWYMYIHVPMYTVYMYIHVHVYNIHTHVLNNVVIHIIITGYLCDYEICAFGPKKVISNVCGFYLCVALHGVWLSYRR